MPRLPSTVATMSATETPARHASRPSRRTACDSRRSSATDPPKRRAPCPHRCGNRARRHRVVRTSRAGHRRRPRADLRRGLRARAGRPSPKLAAPTAAEIDAFEAAARLFSFTGETPIQSPGRKAMSPKRRSPPTHVAARRNRGASFKRVTAASFSVGVMGIVGLLTVGHDDSRRRGRGAQKRGHQHLGRGIRGRRRRSRPTARSRPTSHPPRSRARRSSAPRTTRRSRWRRSPRTRASRTSRTSSSTTRTRPSSGRSRSACRSATASACATAPCTRAPTSLPVRVRPSRRSPMASCASRRTRAAPSACTSSSTTSSTA